jgi:hypothetical protein
MKQEIPKVEPKKIDSEYFDPKSLNFDLDLSKTNYRLDRLQEKFLQFYIRSDSKFRRAFSTNYTMDFLGFIKDKAMLKEPIHLSTMGMTRCQMKGSKILMANGEWKNIEEMKIGDEIISPQKNGKNIFSRIIGISQYISKDNYNFFEKNGKNNWLFNCSSNHIIPTYVYKLKGSARKGTKKHIGDGIAENSADYLFKRTNRNHRIISSFSINRFKNRKNCEINPYFLGLYIGDGHYTKSLGFTNSDKKILRIANRVYKPMNIYHKKGQRYCVTNIYSYYSKVAKLLRKYGLRYKRSGEKFIPKEALLSNIDYRRKLLAGLIDTDGTMSRSCSYSITTKSKQLANDILFLIRSLGGNGKVWNINKTIKSIKFKGKYFKVAFYLGKEIQKIPLKKNNKIRKKIDYWKNTANRISFIIKRKKKCIVYGIEIDSPSKYYITDNMVITHNSGKSYSSISFCGYHQAVYKKKFSIDYICANAIDFLEKLKEFPQQKLNNRIFLIDEEKTSQWGVGSVAKKMKLQDVSNIIAINNVSTISLNPIRFANKDAFYGLRMFGRCFDTKTVRMMLYNLQESAKLIPVGNIYMPIFTAFFPKDYAEKLEKEYLEKKMEWVGREQRGEGDTLAILRRKSAEHFIKDSQYLSLKTHDEKITYISAVLGSEYTRGEVEDIFQMTRLLSKGVIFK